MTPFSDLRQMILQKEGELREMNDYRLKQGELVIQSKDMEIKELSSRLHKLKEDFNFNLKLVEERDEELRRYDVAFANFKTLIRDKDDDMARLVDSQHEWETKCKQAETKLADIDSYYKTQIQTLAHERAMGDSALKARQIEEERITKRFTDRITDMELARKDLEASHVTEIERILRAHEQALIEKDLGLSREHEKLTKRMTEKERELEEALRSFRELDEKHAYALVDHRSSTERLKNSLMALAEKKETEASMYEEKLVEEEKRIERYERKMLQMEKEFKAREDALRSEVHDLKLNQRKLLDEHERKLEDAAVHSRSLMDQVCM